MLFQDIEGLPQGLRQFKGNLHSHTVHSDGCLTPAQSAALYRAQGYSFLCFSEHDRYTDLRAELNGPDFLILPGLEASAVLLDAQDTRRRLKVHHMHGILGTEEMQRRAPLHFMPDEVVPPPICLGSWDGAAVAQQLSDMLRAHGCLVTYNHPIWSRVLPEEFIHTTGVCALEIYNYNTVNESGTGTDTADWDRILRTGRQIYAFASDDNHNEGKFEDSCGGWVSVFAPALTQDAIISALLRGEYYSSSGPSIYGWGIAGDRAWVECSACERVNFIAGGCINAGAAEIAPTRDGLRRASYTMRGDETYLRAECVDYAGKTAWTNAIFPRHAAEDSDS